MKAEGAPGARAEKLAIRVAGANHSRRLYGSKGAAWDRTLEALEAELSAFFEGGDHEVTLALLGDGLAVQGVPVEDPPSAVLRFVGQLKARDVEIVGFTPGVSAADLEALFAYLGGDAADVAAVEGEAWLEERGVEHVRIKHLRLGEVGGAQSFREVYFRSKRVLERQFARAAEDQEVSQGAISELARALVDVVVAGETPLATLLAMKDRDDFAMVHAVNVATLVAAQASTLGLDEADMRPLVNAALTHDIGKTRVPDGVTRPGGRLGDRERALLQRHTIEGARLLADTEGPARLSPIVARFHHERRPPGDPGLLAVELCRLADVFDGVRSLRPFDDPASMRGALAFMARRMGPRFNPYLLSRFARLAGVGARGETGWLSSGEVARVLEPHPELAFHPKVEVIDRGEGALAAGTQLDLHDRLAEGPRYVPKLPKLFRDLEAQAVDDLG